MKSHALLKRTVRIWQQQSAYTFTVQRRETHQDYRSRLSKFWTPTQRQSTGSQESENGYDLLVRAGFVRQAQAGIFHLLPLGLRVQDKIERLIDKHMASLGASKVSLSSISSEQLWQRSGRLDKGRGSEFFRFEDRKGSRYLLSPTHEEEITMIIAKSIHSYKELPLRLYQISRKYRDEARPRQGLLRGREFSMKDLYTFDASEDAAKKTYEEVRKAYCAFLDEINLPYLAATADSGNMGGELSHEYHLASPQGEDTIISCNCCEYLVNEEKYTGRPSAADRTDLDSFQSAIFLSKNGDSAVCVVWPGGETELNIHAVSKQFPNLDTSTRLSREEIVANRKSSTTTDTLKIIYLIDPRISEDVLSRAVGDDSFVDSVSDRQVLSAAFDDHPALLTRPNTNDPCPQCRDGKLHLQQAIEIGHTFHLDTRYSLPLEAQVLDADNKSVHISMGCHGIGISRLIGAASSLLADTKGLNWPYAIAPFGAVIVPGADASSEDVAAIYDQLTHHGGLPSVEAVIDDRERPLGWKLNDADQTGYPFIIVLGRAWKTTKEVELQCRRLSIKENIGLGLLKQTICNYARRL